MLERVTWIRLAVAVAISLLAMVVTRLAFPLNRRTRTAIYLVCSAVVGLSPCAIPLDVTPLRFFASLLSITLLAKLYDIHRDVQIAASLSVWEYIAYLPSGFWLVLRRKPSRQLIDDDLRRLRFRLPAAAILTVACLLLFRLRWAEASFALEHSVKVTAVVLTVVMTMNTVAAVVRVSGGIASDFMRNPLAAATPAEFWRRWNLPAQQFLNEYAFKPAGGLRRPVRGTIVTFAVSGLIHEYVFGIAAGRIQGWQMLYFLLQGAAVLATMPLKPRRLKYLWIAGTCLFNLAASVFFFRSVNQVVPFYETSPLG